LIFYILGALDFIVGEERVDVGGLRQQIVLAVLLLESNRNVRTPRLMEAMYGQDLPSSSRVQVQICISALRRLFTAAGMPDAIATRPQGYSLLIPEGSLDLHRYESSLAAARHLRDSRQPAEAVTQFRSALGLWRGPALDGIESQVVRGAADRLADRRITAHEECIELELGLGRHHEAVDEITALVAEHPLRERLRGQLMLALYRAGRQAEALDTYRAARRRLIDELGLEPNEKLQELEHAILTSDPKLALPDRIVVPPPASEPQAPPPPPQQAATPAPALVEAEVELPRAPVPPALVESATAPGTVSITPAAAAIAAATESQGTPVATIPRLLPTDIADFTGRSKQIDTIEQQVELAAESMTSYAVPVVVMAGKPGIGKTTLAVHVSHRLAGRYPDGQLFADLHGRQTDQIGPAQVLERFLRSLGVPGTALPDGLEERAELYRALLSDRRMLVVLDNAAGESQIRPLLPGSSQSAVLVTSRGRLGGLPGAVHVGVDVFDEPHSLELLARIAGAERVEAEPEASAQLADLCGHLPLALRIAGARLAARPHWSVDHLVERLENEARRLDELKHSGLGIRASISLTYDHLEDDARRLFRLLTVLNFPHFSSWVAAALLDEPFPDAQDLLDDLADAQLIETIGAGRGVHTQYRFHDLIRVYAREQLVADDSESERRAALERVLGALLFLSGAASRAFYGGNYMKVPVSEDVYPLPDRQVRQLVNPPMPWFERERPTIVAAVRQAAQAGLVEHCWSLTMNAVTLFESKVYLSDWRDANQLALAASQQAGDEAGQAAMHYSNGSLYIVEQRYDDARQSFDTAAELFERNGNDKGMAMVNQHVGVIERISGRYAEATDRYSRAIETHRRTGDLVAMVYGLQSLAHVRIERGEPDSARELLDEALVLSRRAGSRRSEAQVLHRLGEMHRHAGREREAIETLSQALVVVRELGDQVGEAFALHGLGVARMRAGDLTGSAEALQEAMRLSAVTNQRLVEARVSLALGELALALKNPPQAVVHLHRALGLFRALRANAFESRALLLLSDAYAAAGNPEENILMPVPGRAGAVEMTRL